MRLLAASIREIDPLSTCLMGNFFTFFYDYLRQIGTGNLQLSYLLRSAECHMAPEFQIISVFKSVPGAVAWDSSGLCPTSPQGASHACHHLRRDHVGRRRRLLHPFRPGPGRGEVSRFQVPGRSRDRDRPHRVQRCGCPG